MQNLAYFQTTPDFDGEKQMKIFKIGQWISPWMFIQKSSMNFALLTMEI